MHMGRFGVSLNDALRRSDVIEHRCAQREGACTVKGGRRLRGLGLEFFDVGDRTAITHPARGREQ